MFLDQENKKIIIEVAGDRPRDFLKFIRQTIKEINKEFQQLEVTEWIPLPDLYKGAELLVEYEELLGYEEGGNPTYYSGKLKKIFPISTLLDGIERSESRKLIAPCHIFISYTHKDEMYKNELSKHLMPLIRLNQASVWNDREIEAGEEWNKEIFDNLERADIVLCLISSSFISSEFCFTKELTQALEAHKKRTKTVIPIRIRKCNWDKLDISKLQGVPSNWFSSEKDDEKWTEVSKAVEDVIQKVKSEKQRRNDNLGHRVVR